MSELFGEQNFADLEKLFSDYAKQADKLEEILQAGADAFVDDLKKLPAPRSKIRKTGYTHLIDVFASRKEKESVLVGWGKYYGPMVEGGTSKMSARPHFRPLWKRNQNKYYSIMINKFLEV